MDNRREFLRTMLIGSTFLAVHPALQPASRAAAFSSLFDPSGGSPSAWKEVPGILARINPPVFPKRDFNITQFGAVGDNKADCTQAFEKAIAKCHEAGGGRVVVPAGEFVSGAIRLRSNVNLHVSAGATIRFTRDMKKYPLVFTRWEGVELMNFSPFIYAFEQENIAITGKGTIDGNCDCEHWWPWKGRVNCGWKKGDPNQDNDRNQLFDMAEKRVPVAERVFGEGHFLRPQFIQPYRCKNVLIEGVTVQNPPNWTMNPGLCEDVSILNVKVHNSPIAQNSDALDLESCRRVIVRDCTFDTGDDGICLKSGKDAAGRRIGVATEDVLIEGCTVYHAHGGFTIGSEMSGGVRNIRVDNCTFMGTDTGLRFKSTRGRGGAVEKIYVSNVRMMDIPGDAINFNLFYGGKSPLDETAGIVETNFPPVTEETPQFRDIRIENVVCRGAKNAIVLQGLPEVPLRAFRLKSVSTTSQQGVSVTDAENIIFENVRVENKTGESLNLKNAPHEV